ncbi:MAG: Hpt domain-containing protein, partial [Alcanivorax sp.]|nr:Hpt domain-containing protein [Alcanivorax sp.]
VLLSNKQVPDWKQLDTLADAVTSIEYYLERLADGISDNDAILRVAEDSLASLGFPVGQEPTWSLTEETEEAPAEVPVAEEPEASAEETTAPETKTSDAELLDDEILGIFVEEAEEVLQTIHEFYPRLRQDHDDREALTEVRRAFHTLKGSGRLVGATSIGELAWSVENLLNRVIDQTIKPTDDMFTLVDQVNARVPSLIEDFRNGETSGDVNELIEQAEALATTRRAETGQAAGETTGEAETADEAAAEHEIEMPETPATAPTSEVEEADDSDDLIDDEILEIFIEEAGEVLDTIREYLPMLLRQHDDRSALAEVRRAFHTLKGSGRMVGATVIGELAWSVENMLNRVIDGSVFMNDDIAQLLQDVTDSVPALVTDFEKRQAPSLNTSAMEARANALANGEIPDATAMPLVDTDTESAEETTAGTVTPEDSIEYDALPGEDEVDPVLLDIFENETETHLQTIKEYLEAAGDKATAAYTDDLSRALHTLKGSANTAGIAPIAEVITPLERFIKESRAQNKRADRDVLALISDAAGFLTQGLAQIRENPQAPLAGTDEYLERLHQVCEQTLTSHAQADDEQPARKSSSQLVQLFL